MSNSNKTEQNDLNANVKDRQMDKQELVKKDNSDQIIKSNPQDSEYIFITNLVIIIVIYFISKNYLNTYNYNKEI